MALYPLFLKLKDIPCLVVGGGPVAQRKAECLLEAEARLTIISPALTPDLEERKAQGAFHHIARRYRKGDAKGFFLIVAATGSRRTDGSVCREASARRALINSASDPERSSFFVPSTLRRGDLQIAISTSGKLPLMARKTRELLETIFDKDIGTDIAALNRLRRNILREARGDQERKRQGIEQILLPEIDHLIERIAAR